MKLLTNFLHYGLPILLFLLSSTQAAAYPSNMANSFILANVGTKVKKTTKVQKTWREKVSLFLLQKELKKAAKVQSISKGASTSKKKQSGLAVISTIMGGGSLVLLFSYLFVGSALAGLLAFGIGRVALKRIKKNPDKYKGKGLAYAGIVMGIASVLCTLLVLALSGLSFMGI